MNVIIGIDPHKASHTAVPIDRDEGGLAAVTVRATKQQTDRLVVVTTNVVDIGPPMR